jgi:hypothetical protein
MVSEGNWGNCGAVNRKWKAFIRYSLEGGSEWLKKVRK